VRITKKISICDNSRHNAGRRGMTGQVHGTASPPSSSWLTGTPAL
jgi:hypothetical protein